MSGTADIDYTPEVLSNRGVPIRLHVLDEKNKPVFDSEGPVYETVYVRFTIRMLARIETDFAEFEILDDEPEKVLKHSFVEQDGRQVMVPSYQATGSKKQVKRIVRGPEALAAASAAQPTLTCITMLSIVLNEPEEVVEAKMIVEDLSVYITSVNVAMNLSQGIDPFVASKAMESCLIALEANKLAQGELLQEQGEIAEKMISDLMEELSSFRGKTGSSLGSDLTEDSTSSST